MTSLKVQARTGLLVGASCELTRAAYRSRNPEDRIDDLAAFKESGGIEYAATLAAVLRSVRGEVGVVDVTTAKNRWGQRLPARLVLDPERATYREVAVPPQAARDLELNSEALFDADQEAVREALRESPGINGKDALTAKVKGIGTPRIRAAIRALVAAGEIVDRGPRRKPRLFLITGDEITTTGDAA